MGYDSRYRSVFIAGHGIRLPPRLTVADAVTHGLCRERDLAPTRMIAVGNSVDESAPELAAAAAGQALERSGALSHEVRLLLYANVFYQGHDMWAPASYVQRVALGNDCPALEVRQMSNGGMAAVDLAAAWLTAAPARSSAVVVAADRFTSPGIDRWHSDPGTVFGDGGAAWVLNNRDGYARVLSLATVSDPELEGMHRGDDPFGDAPYSVRAPLDVKACQGGYLAHAGVAATVARTRAGQQQALERALAEADVAWDQIDWFVLPHFGHRRLSAIYFTPLGIDPDRTTWHWARTVGHLGAGDQLAGLGHLVETGRARPGDRCLLMSVGAGFTWSTAVVEILRCPDRTPTATHRPSL